MKLVAIDHVQLAMPPGPEAEAAARAFYGGLLGLPEVAKPAVLAVRGGLWFEDGPVRLHLGVEEGFRPALKAHPALAVEDLDALVACLTDGGHPPRPGETIGGRRRYFVADPFGNRIELVAG